MDVFWFILDGEEKKVCYRREMILNMTIAANANRRGRHIIPEVLTKNVRVGFPSASELDISLSDSRIMRVDTAIKPPAMTSVPVTMVVVVTVVTVVIIFF